MFSEFDREKKEDSFWRKMPRSREFSLPSRNLRMKNEIKHAGMNGQGDEIGKTASNSTSPKSARRRQRSLRTEVLCYFC